MSRQLQSFTQSSVAVTTQNRPSVLLRTNKPNQVNPRDQLNSPLLGSSKTGGPCYLKQQQQLPASSASRLHPDMLANARVMVRQPSPASTSTATPLSSLSSHKYVSVSGFMQQHQQQMMSTGLQTSAVSDPVVDIQSAHLTGMHSSNSLPSNRYILIGAKSLKKVSWTQVLGFIMC